MALQPRSRTNQAYAQIRGHPLSTSKEGHLVLSNIHSNYKKMYEESNNHFCNLSKFNVLTVPGSVDCERKLGTDVFKFLFAFTLKCNKLFINGMEFLRHYAMRTTNYSGHKFRQYSNTSGFDFPACRPY